MKLSIIYFINVEHPEEVILKGKYNNISDAMRDMNNMALDYVKSIDGERQVNIALQTCSPDEIKNNCELRDGLYLIRDGTVCNVFEKKSTLQGFFWPSYVPSIRRVALFSVTELEYQNNGIKISEMKIDTVRESPKRNFDKQDMTYITEIGNLLSSSDSDHILPSQLKYNKKRYIKKQKAVSFNDEFDVDCIGSYSQFLIKVSPSDSIDVIREKISSKTKLPPNKIEIFQSLDEINEKKIVNWKMFLLTPDDISDDEQDE